MPPPGWPRALAAVWLLACIGVLALSAWAYAPGPRSDAIVLFAWAMLALSFPSGLVVSAILVTVLVAVDSIGALKGLNTPIWFGLPAVWLAFCLAGYAQWFLALPWAWHRLRAG